MTAASAPGAARGGGPGDGARRPVAIVGMSAMSAYGRGLDALSSGVSAGRPAFAAVHRFDVSARRVAVAATLPGAPDLREELDEVLDAACGAGPPAGAGLTAAARAQTPLLLAVHADPDLARAPGAGRTALGAGALTEAVSARAGLSTMVRSYTGACVAASTAVADAAAMIALGRVDRVAVAAGYLVDSDQFALFDAGRALATDGQVRPFSAHRTGLLLGDGVAAVVLESGPAAVRRGGQPLAWLAGWGRSGDAYHVVQPRPDGAGMARAIRAALDRAAVCPGELGYVNAHGSGSPHSDAAETAALRRALGPDAERVPVSSTKSLHGQALEASGLLELVVTVLAVRQRRLPVNAGYLGPDEACRLNVITGRARPAGATYALSLNAAFGGANTALLVGAA